MSVTALVGAQFGSEGKGKIADFLAHEFQFAVRTGGPNAGHSFELDGMVVKVQSVPSTIRHATCIMVIGAGAVIEPELLLDEIERFGLQGRMLIDPNAQLIQASDRSQEDTIVTTIGSTGKGVGAAIVRKIERTHDHRISQDPRFAPYIADTVAILHAALSTGATVLLEGTQGLGLSLHHGFYPYVTGRDTTTGTLLGDAGVAPGWLRRTILVARTYPIRVGGNSGPLRDEIDWATVTQDSGYWTALEERTTVTKRVRRVGRFDLAQVVRSCMLTRPTSIALTFADYLDARNFAVREFGMLTPDTQRYVLDLEQKLGVFIEFIGTGPLRDQMVVRSQ